jgi:hypothetical protein
VALQQDFIVKNGLVVRNTATLSSLDAFVGTSTTLITNLPTLNLNFIGTPQLDARIAFNRSSGATYVGKDGLIKYADVNVPRFDFSPTNVGQSLGLLIEEQRTNYSYLGSDVGNPTYWGLQVGVSGSANFVRNYTTAPDGSNNATFLYHTTSTTSYKNFNQGVAISTGQSYTFSIWVKNAGEPSIGITHFDGYTGLNSYYTSYYWATDSFDTPTIIGFTETSIALPSRTIYPNGWIRIQYTTAWLSGPARTISFKWELSGASAAAGRGFYLWGSQVENCAYGNTSSNYATSYIPTPGTYSVTRGNDNAYIFGNSFNQFFNKERGTMYAEFDTLYNTNGNLQGNNPGVWALWDTATGGYNGYALRIINNSNTVPFQIGSRLGSNFYAAGTYPNNYIVAGQIYKVSGSYYSDPTYRGLLSSNQNGQASQIGSEGNYGLMKFNNLQIGMQNVGGNPTYLNGHVRRLIYYPTVLTDTQLQYLTSSTVYTGTSFANLSPTPIYTANTSNFVVQTGVQIKQNFEVPDVDKYYITNQSKPSIPPSLNLNFLRPSLDSRITFNRPTIASYVGPDGYIKYVDVNVPRFNYSSTSTGTCLGLLVEDQRTNIFANQYVSYGGVLAVGGSNLTGPDGAPANKFTVDATTASSYPSFGSTGLNSFTAGTSIDVTFTGYFGPHYGTKQLEPHIVIQFTTNGASATYNEVQINTANWTIRQFSLPPTITQIVAPTITPAPGGMYRINWTIRYTDDGTLRKEVGTYIQVRDTSIAGIYATDGTSGVQYACCQTEIGSFATSYIPTTTAAVTRSFEYAYITGYNFDKWYNPAQGTLYVEADTQVTNENVTTGNKYRWPVALTDFYGNQEIGFFKGSNSANVATKMMDSGNLTSWSATIGSISLLTPFKAAVAYKQGDQFTTLNAASSSTNTSTLLPSSIIRYLRVGHGDYPWSGHIRRITYYPARLNNTQTQALTVL